MLEGRRRDGGRRAGLTSSPDFLRSSGGFIRSSSSSASLPSDELTIVSVLMGWIMCCESMISLEDRECAILRASADSVRATVTGGCGLACFTFSVVSRVGEGIRFWSMCWSACWSSRRSPMLRPRSSSSEESGGVVIAPLVEGPWRLASDLMSTLPVPCWPFAAVLSLVTEDGDRRDLARYEVDETERGSEGRCDVAGERGAWST
jgi:hypothetical protein